MTTQFRTFVFFDDPKVIRATTRAERRVMNRIGSFIKTTARQSFLRKTKKPKPAPPGSAPRSRTGYLKRGIFYGYSISERAVSIGPVRGGKSAEATAALEYGSSTHRARPYMVPALRKELPKLRGLWRNSVRP